MHLKLKHLTNSGAFTASADKLQYKVLTKYRILLLLRMNFALFVHFMRQTALTFVGWISEKWKWWPVCSMVLQHPFRFTRQPVKCSVTGKGGKLSDYLLPVSCPGTTSHTQWIIVLQVCCAPRYAQEHTLIHTYQLEIKFRGFRALMCFSTLGTAN